MKFEPDDPRRRVLIQMLAAGMFGGGSTASNLAFAQILGSAAVEAARRQVDLPHLRRRRRSTARPATLDSKIGGGCDHQDRARTASSSTRSARAPTSRAPDRDRGRDVAEPSLRGQRAQAPRGQAALGLPEPAPGAAHDARWRASASAAPACTWKPTPSRPTSAPATAWPTSRANNDPAEQGDGRGHAPRPAALHPRQGTRGARTSATRPSSTTPTRSCMLIETLVGRTAALRLPEERLLGAASRLLTLTLPSPKGEGTIAARRSGSSSGTGRSARARRRPGAVLVSKPGTQRSRRDGCPRACAAAGSRARSVKLIRLRTSVVEPEVVGRVADDAVAVAIVVRVEDRRTRQLARRAVARHAQRRVLHHRLDVGEADVRGRGRERRIDDDRHLRRRALRRPVARPRAAPRRSRRAFAVNVALRGRRHR